MDVLHEVISLRNSLRPVNCLPPEVLTSCTTFVSDADPRPIVSLTHVCRYWRRSISSNPRSWASISTGWKRLAPLCLERAGAVPLAVDITVSDIRGDEDFLGSLLPQTSRVAHLSLTGYLSIEAVADDLPGLFASPIPNLTSLELRQIAEPAEFFPPRAAPVPPVFQNVPKLRSLRLTRTPLYPALFGIASLKELKLIGYTNPFHFETVIGFLASNPDLEIADLDIAFVEGSVWDAPARTVSLTRLHRLSITCTTPADARGLLLCISLPRGIFLEVSCSQPTFLGFCLPSPPTRIQGVLAPMTIIRYQESPREIHIFGAGGSLSFRCPWPQVVWGPEFHLFPTASIREFHADVGPWAIAPTFLAPLLAQLPALETLVVARAVSLITGIFDSLAGQPPLCPSLKTIAFFNCGLTSQAMKEFEGVVVKRKGSAAAWLYRVVIVCDTAMALPDSTVIQQLRQHVPCVDVRVDDKLPDLS